VNINAVVWFTPNCDVEDTAFKAGDDASRTPYFSSGCRYGTLFFLNDCYGTL